MGWQRLVEAKIAAAMQAGEFEDLAGTGQPLRLLDGETTDATLWAAFHILRNAGAAPEWIELDGELRGELEAARRELHRHGGSEAAVRRFRSRLADVNRMVDRLNLIVPAIELQRAHFDEEREVRRAQEAREKKEPA